MGAPVFGTVALDGGLEVPAGGVELALPERGDPEHVLALDEEHVVGVALAARAQLLAETAAPREIAPGEAGDRQRAEERRRRFDAERDGELERAPLHLGQTGRGKPFDHAERRRECGEDRDSRAPRSGVSGSARRRSSARSRRRTASTLACSCWAASAARPYQAMAWSSWPARS